MADGSLSKCFFFVDRGINQNKYESIRAKLYQSCAVANLAINSDPTESDLFHVIWCVADLLEQARDEFDILKASDLESIEH